MKEKYSRLRLLCRCHGLCHDNEGESIFASMSEENVFVIVPSHRILKRMKSEDENL